MPRPLSYQKMIEILSFILHCPVCGNKYSADQTSVIESREGDRYGSATMQVHTDCERCKSSVVFNISVEGPEIFSVGMVTDLTSTDAKKFRDKGYITTDEVIEFHDFLETFDGNFEAVLR